MRRKCEPSSLLAKMDQFSPKAHRTTQSSDNRPDTVRFRIHYRSSTILDPHFFLISGKRSPTKTHRRTWDRKSTKLKKSLLFHSKMPRAHDLPPFAATAAGAAATTWCIKFCSFLLFSGCVPKLTSMKKPKILSHGCSSSTQNSLLSALFLSRYVAFAASSDGRSFQNLFSSGAVLSGVVIGALKIRKYFFNNTSYIKL